MLMKDEKLAIPQSEYRGRVRKIQEEMRKQEIDLLVMHGCECESANVRYLSGFWTKFDFTGIVVPRIGEPIFLTGGPESYEFAKRFSYIDDTRIHPAYVETSAPEWDKPTHAYNYQKLFAELGERFAIKKIGIANENIIPYKIRHEIELAAPDAVFTGADDILIKTRWYKSENEISLLKKAYAITEKAFIKALESVRPGISEIELEAVWRGEIYRMGAEGTSYPIWVTSGDKTYQSLCKSTARKIEANDMVQFSVGAKYEGYCGNIGRAVVLGKIPQKHLDMLKTALEATQETLDMIKPGVKFADVYHKFQDRLAKDGFQNLTLYGPAHGTGLQECEGPWVDHRTDLEFQPGMVFNVDVWIANEQYGIRFEDGIAIHSNGVEILTNYKREIIRL